MDKEGIYKGLKGVFNKIPPGKRTQILVVVVMIAVILAIYFSTFTPASSAQPQPTVSHAIEDTQDTSAKDALSAEMESVLSSIQGAGSVRVMITYVSGKEIVPATSENTETTTSSSGSGSGQNSETTKKQTDVVTIQNQSNSDALIL